MKWRPGNRSVAVLPPGIQVGNTRSSLARVVDASGGGDGRGHLLVAVEHRDLAVGVHCSREGREKALDPVRHLTQSLPQAAGHHHHLSAQGCGGAQGHTNTHSAVQP